MVEIICPYCDALIMETDDESEDAYYEAQADHRATNALCEQKWRDERKRRYGYAWYDR